MATADRRTMSLSRRILLAVILVLVAGNLIGVLGFNLLLRGRIRFLEEQFLARQGDTVARMLEEWWYRNGTWEGISRFLDRFCEGPGPGRRHHMREAPPLRFYLLDNSGAVVWASPGLSPLNPGAYRGHSVPLTVEGVSIGTLLPVPHDKRLFPDPLSRFRSGVNGVILLVTGISTLLVLVAGSFVLRRLLRPLEAITRGVRRFGAGDYAVRIDAGGAGELAELEREFNRMAAAVSAADEWKKRLVSDTAHDLRTPLSLLLGQVEMIRDGIYDAGPERLDRIHVELRRLARLVEEMEELARLESGTPLLKRDTFDAGAPVRELLSLHGERAVARRIVLETVREPDTPREITADYGKLLRALGNLLENALNHTPDGGRITITLGPGSTYMVDDTGPGIPAGEEENLFLRFYRADPSRQRGAGGSGLGLAIVKAVMELHGGSVTAGNNPSGGARFTLSFGP